MPKIRSLEEKFLYDFKNFNYTYYQLSLMKDKTLFFMNKININRYREKIYFFILLINKF